MKRIACLCLVALGTAAALVGCGNEPTTQPPVGTTGKIVVNIEGTVTDVKENTLTLDNGQVVSFDDDTVFTDADGTADDADLEKGTYIQGYTADEPTDAEVAAKRIHIVAF